MRKFKSLCSTDLSPLFPNLAIHTKFNKERPLSCQNLLYKSIISLLQSFLNVYLASSAAVFFISNFVQLFRCPPLDNTFIEWEADGQQIHRYSALFESIKFIFLIHVYTVSTIKSSLSLLCSLINILTIPVLPPNLPFLFCSF